MTTATVRHLYRVGELVALDSSGGFVSPSCASFTVVAQLPALGNDLQYRIKSAGEACERMALERHLTRAGSGGAAARGFFKGS